MNVLGSFEGYTSSPLYLYNKGIWSNLQTSGVTVTAIQGDGEFGENSSGSKSLLMKIFGSVTSGKYIMGRLNQTVNLTNYKYLKINDINTTNITSNYIGVSTNSALTSTSFAASTFYNRHGMIVVDISTLTGNYYIYFYSKASNSSSKSTNSSFSEIFLSNS